MRLAKTLDGNLFEVIAVSAWICILVSTAAAQPLPVLVYGVGYKSQLRPELPTELFRFNENGTMEQRWDIPESRAGLSIATLGANLLVAENGRAIDRYSFDGTYLGQFADVNSLAGLTPLTQRMETDSAGNLYTTFGGYFAEPRTSFRLDQYGNITGWFSHPDLVFPRGIDATASGDVYIVNSAGFGVGDRLFRFDAEGTYVSDFAISQVVNPSDIAIDEIRGVLYIADEFDSSIHVYEVSSGVPVYGETLAVPGRTLDVFVEPRSGRIFGTYATTKEDDLGIFSTYTGFELSRDGSLIHTYVEDALSREQTVRAILAVVVPEPDSALPLIIATVTLGWTCRPAPARRRELTCPVWFVLAGS